jgi:hypothetical protein
MAGQSCFDMTGSIVTASMQGDKAGRLLNFSRLQVLLPALSPLVNYDRGVF